MNDKHVKRVLALWLLLPAVAIGGAVITYTRCPGCLARDRVNKGCSWTGDTRFPLDPRNPAHRLHLVEDAQLAEELGIRYADAEFGRRFGVEHHGGLLENGRVRGECLARMFQAIENNHAVTSEQIRVARGQRNPTYDVAVGLLFLPLYSLGAALACRRLGRRFSSSERHARVVATGLLSLAAAFLGTQAFRLWGGVWEVIRVGNGHMTGIRAASSSIWVHDYGWAEFVGCMLIFWMIALICFQAVKDSEPASRAYNANGILA